MELCRAARCLGADDWSEEDKLKTFMNIFHPNHPETKKLNKVKKG